MAGFDNDNVYGKNVDFSGGNPVQAKMLVNGDLLIGSTALNVGGTHINVGTITSTTLSIGYSTPNITIEAGTTIPTTFVCDFGSSTPALNILNVVTGDGLTTTGADNTITITLDGGPIPNPFVTLSLVDDFLHANDTQTDMYGDTGWHLTSGGGVASPINGEANHPGIIRIGTSSNLNRIHKVFDGVSNTQCLIGGGGEIRADFLVRVNNLSTNNYNVYVGLVNNVVNLGIVEPATGYYFIYDDNVEGTNWFAKTANGGVRTSTDSGVTVSANTWYRLTIIINSGNTSVRFLINDVEISGSPLTTNIPSATVDPLVYTIGNGTSSTGFDFDLFQLLNTFSASRY